MDQLGGQLVSNAIPFMNSGWFDNQIAWPPSMPFVLPAKVAAQSILRFSTPHHCSHQYDPSVPVLGKFTVCPFVDQLSTYRPMWAGPAAPRAQKLYTCSPPRTQPVCSTSSARTRSRQDCQDCETVSGTLDNQGYAVSMQATCPAAGARLPGGGAAALLAGKPLEQLGLGHHLVLVCSNQALITQAGQDYESLSAHGSQ